MINLKVVNRVDDFYNVHVKLSPFDRHSNKFYLMLTL